MMKVVAFAFVSSAAATSTTCFVAPAGRLQLHSSACATRAKDANGLQMKLWDFGLNREAITGPSQVDNNWEAQQAILKRRNDKKAMAAYKVKVEKLRKDGDKKYNMWRWQNKYSGDDPIVEWKKMKAAGKLEKVYEEGDDPEGGIPIPMASFGVGGSFGLGGKWDEGARFDLRLPYADQGYVDENEAPMKKLQSLFGFGKKSEAEEKPAAGKVTKAVAAKKSAPSTRRGKVSSSKASSKAKPVEEKPKKKNIFGW